MEHMDIVRTVRLSGKLGAQFGRVHRLAVASTAEAVRALSVMIPGFERELMTSRDRGVAYACFLGKKNIGLDQLHLSGGTEDIRISPRIAGAKSGGFLQIVLGVALIAAAVFIPGVGTFASTMISMGASMAIGGVLQMLVPQQSTSAAADVDNGASYNFNGPVNTTAQGNPVPVLYGRMVVGSAVISAGILAQDQAYVGATKATPNPQKAVDAFMAAL
jgi:predicted phage tail protein